LEIPVPQSTPSQKEIIPIEELIFDGVKQRLHEVFGSPVVLANSTDEIQALRKQQSPQGIKYPYIFGSILNMDRSTDSYRALPFIRRGIDTFMGDTNHVVYKVSLMPVDFNVEIVFKSNDFAEIKKFAKRWLMSIQAGFLKFGIEYGRYIVPIHIVLSESLPVPKREANPENITEYALTTSFIVKGWVSEAKLREQQAYTQVEVEAYMVKEGEKLKAKVETQFFDFKR
jgi:hypothetical protein